MERIVNGGRTWRLLVWRPCGAVGFYIAQGWGGASLQVWLSLDPKQTAIYHVSNEILVQ
jgi:hypothetical protein